MIAGAALRFLIATAKCSRLPRCTSRRTAPLLWGNRQLDMSLEQPDRVAMLIKRRMGLPDFGHPVAGARVPPRDAIRCAFEESSHKTRKPQLRRIDGCVITGTGVLR